MYTIHAGDLLVYGNDTEVIDPRLRLEAGQAGRLEFQIYEGHPAYGQLKKLDGIVTVERDGEEIFAGRVIEDELDLFNRQKILCEGLLAIFNDSVIRPYQYAGSVNGYIQLILDQHNSQVEADKQVRIGIVTVTDPNDYIVRADSSYPTTWQLLVDKCVNLLGGYFFIRRSGGLLHLDYLADSPYRSEQIVRTGENLLDVKQSRSGTDIATCLIPLGAKNEETGERLGIKSVNGGLDYVFDADAIIQFGRIFRTETWDNITVPAILKTRAQDRLSELVGTPSSITLKTADLSMIDKTIDDFRLFEYVEIDSPRHGLQDEFLVLTQDIALDRPNGELTLGRTTRSFTSRQVSVADAVRVIRAEYATRAEQNHMANSLADLNRSVANAAGMYSTETTTETGAKRYYYHDAPTLEESQVIEYYPEPGSRVWTSTGWNDGSPVWQYGNDQHGLLVMRLISTVGIDAEWINLQSSTLSQYVQDVDATLDLTLSAIIPEYYLSTSPDSLQGGSWSTTDPGQVAGKYVFTRSKIVRMDGSSFYSPVSDVQSKLTVQTSRITSIEAGQITLGNTVVTQGEAIDGLDGTVTTHSSRITTLEGGQITLENNLITQGEQLGDHAEAISQTQAQIEAVDGALLTKVNTSDYDQDRLDMIDQITGKADHSDLVELEDLQATMLQTQDQWAVVISEVQDITGEHEVTVDQVKRYMSFGVDGLTIGDPSSSLRIRIDNERISFLDGSAEVAYITGQRLHITAATIVDSLQVGNHKIEKWGTDGQYTVFKYIGG